ncbi:MAG TPA: DUF4153 domain-containing protein [Lentimicrobium sp.]|nr:DUF4153 domain-containing protein [Lentimicrobium sp.]
MRKIIPVIPFFFAILYPVLFHRQQAGLNVLILNLIIFGLLIWSKRLNFMKPINFLVLSGCMISSLMVVIHGSQTALTINILSLLIMSGLLAAPQLSVLSNSFLSLFVGGIVSPYEYLKETGLVLNSNRNTAKGLRAASFLIIPVIIVLVFVSLYSASSPYYHRLTGNTLYFIDDLFKKLFEIISPPVFWIGIAGLASGIVIFFSKVNFSFDLPFEKGNNELVRKKQFYAGSFLGLKYEYRNAVLTFILLNLALAVMNFLDLWHVWINFEWDGGFLKQFVHEGTWLLILSILISIILVLWYFRGNINFYPRNSLLKNLTKIWLFQNVFLALSVAVRNYWYLHYFNLAYKRIWVFAFLILVLFGLFTVFIKVRDDKTLRYLFIRNSIAAYIVFVVLSLFNWDNVIAKFNINRSGIAFFHTDFMHSLDSSTLPILIMDDNKLAQVKNAQASIFSYHANYMSLENYNASLKRRKADFLTGYPKLHWLSWTVSDYTTYQKLK